MPAALEREQCSEEKGRARVVPKVLMSGRAVFWGGSRLRVTPPPGQSLTLTCHRPHTATQQGVIGSNPVFIWLHALLARPVSYSPCHPCLPPTSTATAVGRIPPHWLSLLLHSLGFPAPAPPPPPPACLFSPTPLASLSPLTLLFGGVAQSQEDKGRKGRLRLLCPAGWWVGDITGVVGGCWGSLCVVVFCPGGAGCGVGGRSRLGNVGHGAQNCAGGHHQVPLLHVPPQPFPGSDNIFGTFCFNATHWLLMILCHLVY